MRGRTWAWLAGGGVVAWLLYKANKKPTKPGALAVTLVGFKTQNQDALQAAVLNANATCVGMPTIKGLSRTPTTSGGPDSRSMGLVVMAEWTHDVLGPIKEEVRACLEQALQTVDPGVRVAAQRLT